MIETLFQANQDFNEEIITPVLEKQFYSTYPEGSLGRVQEMIIRLASQQGSDTPKIHKPWLALFACDHGIASEATAEQPQSMTAAWTEKLLRGQAATNVLVKTNQLNLEVIDVGLVRELNSVDSEVDFINAKVAPATQDFTQVAAMSQDQLIQAMEVGMKSAERAHAQGSTLFLTGEIGVANEVSALAMVAVLSGKAPLELMEIGREMVMRSDKAIAEQVSTAIELHRAQLTSPLRILQYLGGFETAALCGAYIRCAQLGMTVVVDGYMSTVAAWIADMVSRNDQLMHCKSVEMMMDLGQFSVPETMFCICGNCPRLVEWCFFSQNTANKVQGFVLEILAVDALLDFDMSLGQGLGSALVVPLLRQACDVQQQLAAFTEVPQEDSETEALNAPAQCVFTD